jgi:IS30 family transposase
VHPRRPVRRPGHDGAGKAAQHRGFPPGPADAGGGQAERTGPPFVHSGPQQLPGEGVDRWEGDLILGKDNRSAIGTLVERSTRFVMLLHLPDGRDAATVATAMTDMIATLPPLLLGSLTWDQGKEMAHHRKITTATGLRIYFCDPHSPWQRGSNENTNGLLRQYFPKGTELSQHTAAELDRVAAELNGRPRETLGWRTPAEALTTLLLDQQTPGVATTA